MTFNGNKIEVKGKNLTIAEVHRVYDAVAVGKKVGAVLPSWNKAVLVNFYVPKDVEVQKGTRLLIEANLGALYVDEIRPRFVEKAS